MSDADSLLTQAVQQVAAAPEDRLDLALDTAASLLAASGRRPALSRAVLRYGEQLVGQAWARGWRPADLVRVVRRELGVVPVALAVDLIAAEGRRHAEATLDRRWREQLRELAAEVWWPGDAEYLEAFGAWHRLDGFALATALLELLRIWRRLPPLTPVGAAPGQAAVTAPLPGEPKQLSKIRALLAKAESTEYPDEAEALTAKAQQLMALHSIDTALLAAGQPSPDAPGALRIGIDSPYESAKTMLLDAVAAANRSQVVWDQAYGFCTLVGFDADLDAVELMYTSLLVQATAAMNRAGGRQHRAGAAKTKQFRQSFLVAYAARIRERLAAAAEQATHEQLAADGRLLPVLKARDEAVEETVTKLFPKLVSQRVRVRDGDGWLAGRAAADRAALSGPALDA